MSIQAKLRELIKTGHDPEDATRKVLDGVDDLEQLRGLAWPVVLRMARQIEGQVVNAVMRRSLGNGDGAVRSESAEEIHGTVYKTPDGGRVLWDDLTMDEIEGKISWLRVHVGSLVDHLLILVAARDVLVEHGAMRLGDVPGWVALVQHRTASAPVLDLDSMTTRKPTTGGNRRLRKAA